MPPRQRRRAPLRVLVPLRPLDNEGYPPTVPVAGLERATITMVDALVALGHRVTMLVPRNFPVTSPHVAVLRGDYATKRELGRMPLGAYGAAVVDACDSGAYDCVLMNDMFGRAAHANAPMMRALRSAYAARFCFVHHHYDDDVGNGMYAYVAQFFEAMRRRGARIYTVSAVIGTSAATRRNLERIVNDDNPRALAALPHDAALVALPTHMRHLDINVIDPDVARAGAAPTASDGAHVMVGRAVPEKQLVRGVEAWLAARRTSPERCSALHVFTIDNYQVSDTAYMRMLKTLCAAHVGDGVRLHLNVPRVTMFRTMLRASVFLFASRRESSGLAAFEALCCGLTVLHRQPNARYFLDAARAAVGDCAAVEMRALSAAAMRDAIVATPVPSLAAKRRTARWARDYGSVARYRARVAALVAGE